MYAWNSSPGGPDPDDARGVSEVLGIVLVLGMVIAATVVIVTVGATSFQQSQEQVTMESAVTSMEELNNRIMQVSSQSGGQASVTLSDVDSSNLRVENAGWVNVSIEHQKNGTLIDNRTTGKIKLGKIVYERDGQFVALQAGGMWRGNVGSSSAAMVTNPPIGYQYQGGSPTMQFPIIQIDDVSIEGNTVQVAQSKPPIRQLASVSPLKPGEQANITVKSEYYQSWETLFEGKITATTVENNSAENTVNVTLTAPPEPISVNQALTIPGNVGLGGDFKTFSYDSRTTSGAGSIGIGNYHQTNNGDVLATEGGSTAGSATINGDLYLDGDFETGTGTAEVTGNIYATGTVTIGSSPVTNRVIAGGDIKTNRGGITFKENSELKASGDFISDGNEFRGDIHVGEDIEITGWPTLASTFSAKATGSIDIPNANGGTVEENASAPTLNELSVINSKEDKVPDPSGIVDRSVAKYKSTNDNGTATFSSFNGGANVNDHLTTGNYYFDGDLSYSGTSSLTFDTTNGEIHLVVDGDFTAGSLDMEILGNERVHMYVTGNVEITGAGEYTNSEGRGDQFWIYTAEDTETTQLQTTKFYGVMLSDSTIDMGGNTKVYGAMVVPDAGLQGSVKIYYDEALKDIGEDRKTNFNPGTVSYLHITAAGVGS